MDTDQCISTAHTVEVRGDFACWSRPELKVERWSYPCPTPSAARSIFDGIYFRPQFYWQVDRIEMLRPPQYIALRRNEVSTKGPSPRTIAAWAKGSETVQPLFADAPEQRQQRQTMALRDPCFRIQAHIVPRGKAANRLKSFNAQFRRRAAAGKCFWQPYLGCREFVAFFRLVDDLGSEPPPVDFSQQVGWMLYDVFDLTAQNKAGEGKPLISVFEAEINRGVLSVPPYASHLVLKAEPGRDA